MSSRYESYGRADAQFFTDGDFHFKGIDMKHDRSTLSSGMVAKSINKRLRTGVAETRPGSRVFRTIGANPILGSMVYKNPNGREQLLVAESGRNFVWAFEDGQPDQQVFIRATTGGLQSLAPSPPVWFIQAFDKVLLCRGGITPYVWNGLDYGITNAAPTSGFRPIQKSNPADTSTNLVGAVSYGIPFQSRVLYVFGKDQLVMSDVLDYSSYDPVLSMFRINAGEADRIICIQPYGKDAVAVFMNRSIHMLSNFTVDSRLAQQMVVSHELGAVGREATVQVGADIIFLAQSGIYRLSQVLDTQIIAAPVPISDPISPVMEGIAWDLVDNIGFCSMAMLGDYCYIVLPLSNTFPRNVLVYNTVTSEWESVDAWEDSNTFFNALRVTLYQGERRLFALNHVTAHTNVYLMYEGVSDQTGITHPVNDILETRGYMQRDQNGNAAGADTWKNFKKVNLTLRTRNSSVTVAALMDGYNEVKNLTPIPIEKSATQFYSFAHSLTFNTEKPYRKSYYTGSETTWVAQDMSNLLPGRIDLLPAVHSEELGGPKTESMERLSVRTFGRWCSIRIQGTRDQCDIIGCSVDSQEARRDTHTLA